MGGLWLDEWLCGCISGDSRNMHYRDKIKLWMYGGLVGVGLGLGSVVGGGGRQFLFFTFRTFFLL